MVDTGVADTKDIINEKWQLCPLLLLGFHVILRKKSDWVFFQTINAPVICYVCTRALSWQGDAGDACPTRCRAGCPGRPGRTGRTGTGATNSCGTHIFPAFVVLVCVMASHHLHTHSTPSPLLLYRNENPKSLSNPSSTNVAKSGTRK